MYNSVKPTQKYTKEIIMSLFIEVYVGSRHNRKLVASTHAYNVSNLNKISDYEFTSDEYGYEPLSIPPQEIKGEVKEHDREQSVWKLVSKIANETVKGLI